MAVRNFVVEDFLKDFVEDYEPMQIFSYTDSDDYEVIFDEWEENWDLLNPKHSAIAPVLPYVEKDDEDEMDARIFPIALH